MLIIKIGGGETINLKGIILDLASIKDQFIIVHGANAARDSLAKQLGLTKKIITSVSGYNSVFSDEKAIELIMMAYAGLMNKKIVELCQQNEINAIGLSGIDGKLIQGRRNQGIRVKENNKVKIVRDFSGKPKTINKKLLDMLLENGYIPVISIPIIDETNAAINSENDDIITLLQKEFHAEKIIQLIEAQGFLENKDDPHSLIKEMSKDELSQRESQVEGRMKRKILALRNLFETGAAQVIISDGRTEHPLQDALNGRGTVIE